MTVGAQDGASRQAARSAVLWLRTRSATTYLVAGWIVFVLGSYPGFMSVESAMQLFDVRNRVYTDAHPPVMTAIWGLFEYVAAGPFPMLALQSGLFLFGLAAVLRTVLAPRAAAITAAAILLFPPVFSPMAVIWPDSLMAGALLAGVGASLDKRRGWRITGGVLLAIACACRMEIVLAVIPLALLAAPNLVWWRRAALAVAITFVIGVVAHVADWAATDTKTYVPRQALMVMDLIGTLRRAKLKDEAKIRSALADLPIADAGNVRERLVAGHDALDWWPLTHGDQRILDPIRTDDQAAALGLAWRHAITAHPGAYLTHRWAMTRSLLGISGHVDPIYDDFGDAGLMAPLHHRATSSDWQVGMGAIVHAVGKTPLYRPWLYVLLAIAAIVLARRHRVIRALVVSGVVYEVTVMLFASGPDYRFSHWLITTTCIALAALLVTRKPAWRTTADPESAKPNSVK